MYYDVTSLSDRETRVNKRAKRRRKRSRRRGRRPLPLSCDVKRVESAARERTKVEIIKYCTYAEIWYARVKTLYVFSLITWNGTLVTDILWLRWLLYSLLLFLGCMRRRLRVIHLYNHWVIKIWLFIMEEPFAFLSTLVPSWYTPCSRQTPQMEKQIRPAFLRCIKRYVMRSSGWCRMKINKS